MYSRSVKNCPYYSLYNPCITSMKYPKAVLPLNSGHITHLGLEIGKGRGSLKTPAAARRLSGLGLTQG